MKSRRLILAVSSLAFLSGIAVFRGAPPAGTASGQTSGPACCGMDAAQGPRELDFPYYTLRAGYTSTLNLVSDSPQPLDFIVALYSLSGQALIGPSMTIQPSAKLPIDLGSFITGLNADPDGPFGEGSIAIYFQGTIMPLVGQVTMTNPTQRLANESEMVENDPGRSDIPPVLNGLWWGLAGGRDARIVVANMSGQAVTADASLDFSGAQHPMPPLAFAAHETKVLSVAEMLGQLNVSVSQAPEGGITIVQRGSNPSLIAQGRVTDPVTGFSTTLEFPDPARQFGSALHASALPIGQPSKDSPFAGAGFFVPHVVVRNLLSTPQSVSITVEYPQGALVRQGDKEFDGESGAGTGQLQLAPLSVEAHSTMDFSLDAVVGELPLPLAFASLRLAYSGAPGSLIAQISSVDSRQDLVVDARVANEGDGWAGSGANPWHLDEATESILFLTNEGDRPARIGFSVTAGGVHYYLIELRLAPQETRAIDLRKLRDAHNADFRKNAIPAAATDGSVSWIRLDDVPVTGRLLVISRHGGVASAYDCCTCPCPASLTSCWVSPGSFDMLPGTTTQCTCTAAYQNCNGGSSYYNETSEATWSSSNTSIAYMDGTTKGLVHNVAAGFSTITAKYSGYTYKSACQPQPCTGGCVATCVADSGSSSCNVVTATITVHFTGSKSAGDSLSFEKSSSECSESLGLLNCPTQGWWHWNVEVEGVVSDDASDWTASQSQTGSASGYYKDSSGNLHSFSYSINQPSDGPDSAFLQQPAGQKTIFWIDGPGHGYLQNGYKVDSMTQIQDFTSKVCSNITSTTCESVKWYFKLVVNPGAVLDTTNSSAGLGSK